MRNESVPWICPRCAHFCVRVDGGAPSHECRTAGEAIESVRYIDSDQAMAIRNRFAATRNADGRTGVS